jgi:predicted dehydrogenase
MSGLNVGVIGCGYWGSKHVRVLQGLSSVDRVVAIDGRPDRLAAMAAAHPRIASSCFLDLEEALEHVDALVIATPPNSHADLALAAMAAGKSVLVEKPIATSVADTDKMISVAADEDVTLMVGHTFQYNAAVWKARELIETGELGRLHYLDSARLNLGLYQSDVDVIWDLAPHDVSIFNHLLQATPTSVRAWGATHAHPRLVDVAHIHLDYADLDVSASIHVSWLDPCKVRRTTVVGDRKMLVYNDINEAERLRIFDKGVTSPGLSEDAGEAPMLYRFGDTRSPYIEFHEPLAYQDQHFVDCVATGKTPTTDGFVGRDVVAVLEAAHISLEEQRPVEIEPSLSSVDSRLSMSVGL